MGSYGWQDEEYDTSSKQGGCASHRIPPFLEALR
jgi:hypothetical protein